jgi:hypothetical protein
MDIKYITIIAALSIAGCGGGGGGGGISDTDDGGESGSTSQGITGTFLDSAVGGINYQTESRTGTTNTAGEFLFEIGETVTFSIGDAALPIVAAGTVITPLDIVNTQDVNDVSVTNLARLLQTLDIDGDTSNGISIGPDAHLSAPTSIDLSSPTFDADTANLVANSGAVNTTLISGTEAVAHLKDTLGDAGLRIVGSWYIDSANKTLITFIDESNYFLTQDVDNIGEPLCSDGMEAGTYTWDSATGSLSLINIIDTTGDCGLTSTQGGTYDATAVIDGYTLNITDNEGTFSVSKVSDASNPISGGWYEESGNKTLITFVDATNYFVTQDVDDVGEPLCSDGMETGTYTWTSETGAFSLLNVIDTTGDCGLTSTQGETYNAIITVTADEMDIDSSITLSAVR